MKNKKINHEIINKFCLDYTGIYSTSSNLNVDNFFDYIPTNSELHHAFNCYLKIPESRKLKLPDKINEGAKYETVIFENRQLPHIEYLLRNCIHYLGQGWKHTIVCTDDNYKYISLMASSIHQDINIINLGNLGKINQNIYNNIFLSKQFWKNFTGEKILIYQQDADIYHGRINEFLEYDYIGAPWPEGQNDNRNNVGNGGFSLRTTQKMIDCLNLVDPDKLSLGESTIKYMDGLKHLKKPLKYPPEDVYFSKVLIDYNIGKVAEKDIAKRFANETYSTSSALGSHQYWAAGKAGALFQNINNYTLSDWSWATGEAKQHVSGWHRIIEVTKNLGAIDQNNNGDVLLVDNLEKHFLWDTKGIINQSWVGITHTTPNTPNYLSNLIDIDTLLYDDIFIKSLANCVCIVTLSKYMQQYVQSRVPKIKVIDLKHPTDIEDITKFTDLNIQNIFNSPDLKIIQLGQQMRYMTSIYRIKTNYKKVWLTGQKDLRKMKRLLINEVNWLDIEIDLNDVEMKFVSDMDEYNQLIYNNVVMIDLIDASANNAVLELAACNIPFFIKKLPAVVEYLGYNYPGYIKSYTDMNSILSDRENLTNRLYKCFKYLQQLNLEKYNHNIFATELLKIINQ